MIPYVLGIDSGGTKYLVRAAAVDGTILGEFRGNTCSHYYLGKEKAARETLNNLGNCLARFGGRPQECLRIVCGSTGYDSPEDGALITNIYENLPGFDCPVYCVNDVELAHYIATGGVGVLALAGTGSIAFGRNKNGKEVRVGGWFKSIMGDEGSGRYIDAKALHHYSRWLDGCRPSSPLLKEIERVVGSPTRKALMDYSLHMASPPWPAANLGEMVDRAALEGDRYATQILHDAAACNFDLVQETIQLLHMEQEQNLCVGIWGSVLMNSAVQREEFKRLLLTHYPQTTISIPKKDAAQGAVDIALRWYREGGSCWKILRNRK